MLNSIKIPNSLKDIFKIIVGVKILSFILISAIESYEDIKETRDTND